MNLEKVIFGFFIVLAATLNFGFFIGDIDRPELHNVYELAAALVVSLIATALKFGDRTQIGAIHLSTSLVADLQLIAAAVTWAVAVHVTGDRHDAARHLERRLAVRRRAVRQRRLGHHPDRRNRDAPPLGSRDVNSAFFLVLRRMRAPIIVLIVIYAISVIGLTLVPGVDAEGKAAPPLSFFHAFYFVSYTATTIGFGEIPSAFSDAQRMWVTICIYLTVIGWSYSVVTLIALLQDKGFQNTLTINRFGRRVRRTQGTVLPGLRLRRNRQPDLPDLRPHRSAPSW